LDFRAFRGNTSGRTPQGAVPVNPAPENSIVRFATFELDLKEEQLRKGEFVIRGQRLEVVE